MLPERIIEMTNTEIVRSMFEAFWEVLSADGKVAKFEEYLDTAAVASAEVAAAQAARG